MNAQTHFAVYKEGKPYHENVYLTLQYAASAWEECEPDCDVVELDALNRVVTLHHPDVCRLAAQRFRNPPLTN